MIYYYFFKLKGFILVNVMLYVCEMMNCEYYIMFLLMLNIYYFKILNIKVSIYWELNFDYWRRGYYIVCYGDL